MVYAVAWWAWCGIWMCLAGLAWYMVCPCGHGMVYGILARYWIAYGVAWQDDMYMVWTGGHGMVYGMVYRACHDIWCGLAGMEW